jgi:hypothetical protein
MWLQGCSESRIVYMDDVVLPPAYEQAQDDFLVRNTRGMDLMTRSGDGPRIRTARVGLQLLMLSRQLLRSSLEEEENHLGLEAEGVRPFAIGRAEVLPEVGEIREGGRGSFGEVVESEEGEEDEP